MLFYILLFTAEVTVLSGQGITIHHSDDKEALPLALHHIPICVTFALFEEAKVAVEVRTCACSKHFFFKLSLV
jgi:exosome complex RNA-binding protein Rrp42 (RNase PH superfamily)